MSDNKKLALIFFLLGAALVVFIAFAVSRIYATFDIPQVTICHATHSEQNPFNRIVVNWTAVDGIGNSDHNRSGHQDGEDIIPPGFWDQDGRNWNEEGQAIWRNECEIPEEEPVDVCENLEGVQEETPEGYKNDEGYCYIPEEPKDYCDTLEGVQAEDEDCPKEEEPTPTPTEEPKPHNPPTFAGSSTESFVCDENFVDKEAINFHIYRNGDQAIAKWWPTGGNKATIYYKQVSSPDWQYSVDVDNTGYAEINALGNLDITFALQQHQGCGSGVLSTPVVDGDTSNWVLYR